MTAHPVYLFYTKNQVTETLRAPLYKEGPPCVPFIIRKKKTNDSPPLLVCLFRALSNLGGLVIRLLRWRRSRRFMF